MPFPPGRLIFITLGKFCALKGERVVYNGGDLLGAMPMGSSREVRRKILLSKNVSFPKELQALFSYLVLLS